MTKTRLELGNKLREVVLPIEALVTMTKNNVLFRC